MRVNGLEIGIDVIGKGPRFIWNHGLLSSRAFDHKIGLFEWESLQDILRIIRYDARGHGESEASYVQGDYEWSHLATDMIQIADAVEADRFILGGASMGCGTALCATVSASSRIMGLLLVCPPTAWETRKAQRQILESLSETVKSKGISALVPLFLKNPLLPKFLLEEMPEMEKIFIDHVLTQDQRVISLLFMDAANSDFPSREALKLLEAPSLILAWSGDKTHPTTTAEELNSILPNSKLNIAHSLKEAKHWPHLVRTFVGELVEAV